MSRWGHKRTSSATFNYVRYRGLIPFLIDQHPWAQSRVPIDMIFQGWSMRLFQA